LLLLFFFVPFLSLFLLRINYLFIILREYRWDYTRDVFRSDRRPGSDTLDASQHVRLVRSRRTGRPTFISFVAPPPTAPTNAPKNAITTDKRAAAASDRTTTTTTTTTTTGVSAWDAADTSLEATTEHLLFSFKTVGSWRDSSRTACSDEVEAFLVALSFVQALGR